MISNASPLIFFSRINKLDLLCTVFPKIYIPEEVFDEVVKRGRGSPDAILIQEYIGRGNLTVKRLSAEYQKKTSQLIEMYPQLDRGEADVISLALQEHEKEVLMDDNIGRKAAELNGLIPSGSLRVLLLAFQRKIISKEEVLKMVGMLLDAGFYIGPEVLERFYEMVKKMERR